MYLLVVKLGAGRVRVALGCKNTKETSTKLYNRSCNCLYQHDTSATTTLHILINPSLVVCACVRFLTLSYIPSLPMFFSSFARTFFHLSFPPSTLSLNRARRADDDVYPYRFSLTFSATGDPDDASYRWKYTEGAIEHPKLEGASVSLCECAELCAEWPKNRCDGFYYNLER